MDAVTFIRKFNGRVDAPNDTPIVATYTCPAHGEMDVEVRRDANGEAPDVILCPVDDPFDDCIGCGGQPSAPGASDCALCNGTSHSVCSRDAGWTASPVAGRVRRVEVSRGKWEPPERKSYLDTRKLGEGQDPEEFRKERKKMWTEKRLAGVKELLR